MKLERIAAVAGTIWMSQRESKRPPASLRSFRTPALLALLAFLSLAATAQDSTTPATQSPGSTQTAQPSAATVPQAATPTPAASQDATLTKPLPALPDSLWTLAGKTVASLKFEGVSFSSNDAIFSELTQKAGQPLDPAKVRDDLRRLFATGRYRNISVYAVPSGPGITLVFAGDPRFFVGRVTIVGVKEERLASLLEFATRLDPGTPFVDTALATAATAVKQSLAENGFYHPVVEVTTTVDEVGHQVNATFIVHAGPQARVGAVALEAASPATVAASGVATVPPIPPTPGITVPEFRKQAGLNCSRLALFFNKHCVPKVERETTSNALSGVRAYYQKHDRLEGTISLQKSTYDDSRLKLDYLFAAGQGPIVRVIINGVKLSKSRVKLLIPVFEEGAVDNDLLNEGAFNLKDYLQQKGYFDATATVQLLGKDTGNVTVQYDVTAGKEHKVTQVYIKGNKYFDHDTIEELLRVKKADAYQRSGRYSAQLVAADVTSIEAIYRANGFSAVKATSAVKDIDKGPNGQPLKQERIEVTFTIVEGAQQKFGNVQLTGVDPSREQEIRSMLSSQTGQPFSLITLSGDRDAVLGYYLSHGFDHAKIEIGQGLDDEDATRTDVALRVTEGQQVFIDQVLLSGLGHTRPRVVAPQILVHPGDPLDQAALLQTQRNLYNLALFNEVNAAVQDPNGDAPDKNVLVQLTEARRWDVNYGFGFEAQLSQPAVIPGNVRGNSAGQNGKAGASPRGSVDVSRINLRGTQNSLTLHTTFGLLEEVATLSFNVPQLFGNRNLTGSVSGGYSNVQNITTFASKTLQGDFRVTQKVKRADTFIYDFQYRRVSINEDTLEITPNLIPQLSEPVEVAGPQITYFHDTRDPSPLNAGKGQYFSIQEFIADSKFGSGTNFNKVDITQSTYYTFGKKKYVFARNTRVGFENAWGPNPNAVSTAGDIGVVSTACAGTLLQINPTCNPVPLPERLYAGGATSHRGFGINAAGPRDLTTGFPVGGSGVVVNTFELRLPPPTLPVVGDSISFVIFHDMGNVFQKPGSEMFSSIRNFKQPDQAACRNLLGPLLTAYGNQAAAVGSCNFNYYSHAVGVGLRYNTPVGPIRVDFSYNLNPPIYPVFDDFSKANPDVPGHPPYVGQGGHFNFFFSIGQSF